MHDLNHPWCVLLTSRYINRPFPLGKMNTGRHKAKRDDAPFTLVDTAPLWLFWDLFREDAYEFLINNINNNNKNQHEEKVWFKSLLRMLI